MGVRWPLPGEKGNNKEKADNLGDKRRVQTKNQTKKKKKTEKKNKKHHNKGKEGLNLGGKRRERMPVKVGKILLGG